MRLFQRRADRAEVGVERRANAVHGGDDGNRDTRGDKAVFDGRGTGFVLKELRNERLHGGYDLTVPAQGAARSSPAGPCPGTYGGKSKVPVTAPVELFGI